MQLADDANAHYEEFRQQKRIDGYEWIANFTGTDGGMLVMRGDPQKLADITATPEFQSIIQRGLLLLESWHWDLGAAGATVDEIYPGYRELVSA